MELIFAFSLLFQNITTYCGRVLAHRNVSKAKCIFFSTLCIPPNVLETWLNHCSYLYKPILTNNKGRRRYFQMIRAWFLVIHKFLRLTYLVWISWFSAILFPSCPQSFCCPFFFDRQAKNQRTDQNCVLVQILWNPSDKVHPRSIEAYLPLECPGSCLI